MEASYNAYNDYAALQAAIAARQAALKDNPEAKELLDSLAKLQKSVIDVGEGFEDGPGIGPRNRDISRYLVMIESADMRPAASAQTAVQQACAGLQKNLETWEKLNAENVAALGKQLERFHTAVLPTARPVAALKCD